MKLRTLTALLFLFCCFGCPCVHAQLIIPGDFPDPSVTKIGNTYWATATTSNWGPVFPILSSDNLEAWQWEGSVFTTLPEWADYYFWAPEISYENGKVYVYYSAHKRGGNLCIGVATADQPTGPYRDLGPIMCQEAGSIDAFPMRDENGKLFLIWKEDGNSVKKPTPIWAMEMKEDRSGLIGEKLELFRNDQPWEGNLVEGVSMMRHGEYYYAFYAAGSCCGVGCNYVTGVARSKKLLGPWQKYEKNPILGNSNKWICPGHGTPAEFSGRYYFLYHAYDKQSNVYTGRQGMLQQFTFTVDEWVKFEAPDPVVLVEPMPVNDDFDMPAPLPSWQWSVFSKPEFSQRNGQLYLSGTTAEKISYVALRTELYDYHVRVALNRKETTAQAGLAIIGDDEHIAGVQVKGQKVIVYSRNGKNTTEHVVANLPNSDVLYLELKVDHGKNILASFSVNDKEFITLNATPFDVSFMPPWDRALRVGVTAVGSERQVAVFDMFSIK